MTIEYTLPTSIRLIMTSHKVIMELSEKKDVNESDYLETFSGAMDHLCLALAFLTNLLQEGSELVFSLHNTSMSILLMDHYWKLTLSLIYSV